MPPIPLRMGQWRYGADYRMTTRSARGRGLLAFSPWSPPSANPFTTFLSDSIADLTGGALPKLFVTDSPPFSADDQGNAYPAGQLWACAWGAGSQQSTVLPGAATPETHGIFSPGSPGRKMWLMYRASGIKDSADGTITLKTHSAGTTLATIDVFGVDGANQTILFDEFDGFTGDTIDVVADWGSSTGDIPHHQAIVTHPQNGAEFWAIPTTLPTGYTARTAGNFHYQSHGNRALLEPGTPRPGPYRTPENLNLNVPGIGPCSIFLWIGGVPWDYRWQPEAINQASFLVLAQATADIVIPPPVSITIPGVITNGTGTTHGLRSWSLFIQCQDSSGAGVSTGGAGYTVVVTRTDTGATLVNQTYSTADLAAGQTVTGSTVEHATLGSDVTLTVTLTRSGSPHTSGTVFAWFRGAFRCDIPLPYAITGAGQVVGGGYLPSKLIAPTFANSNTLTLLGSGVTSYTPPQSGKPVAFLPGADGWYRVTQSSIDRSGVGENEFDHGQSQSANRGHTGRPFYAFAANTSAMALATYTPSFGAIATSGTTLPLTAQAIWAFGSIALPAAGTYKISVIPTDTNAVLSGLVFEWSTTDATCVATDGQRLFKSMDVLAECTDARWAGTASTPPAPTPGPGTRSAWIVGANPTGDFVGHENDVAVSDEVANGWRFYTPTAGAYMFNLGSTDWTWFDGTEWKASTDPVMEILVTVAAATSVACTLRWYTNERSPSSPHYKVSWVSA